MTQHFDVAIVGAGPAGMSAAMRLRAAGATVVLIDEQAAPGGQIWRAVENNHGSRAAAALGPDYRSGAERVATLRRSGAELRLGTQMWKIEDGWTLFVSKDRAAERIAAQVVLLATGAQERPNPFPGWTLPGVMTVGAAQIALKAGHMVPSEPVWIAGSGPLPLLYMVQLLQLGGRIAGYLDTTPRGNLRAALPYFPAAIRGWQGLLKGSRWLRKLRQAGVPFISNVRQLEAIGSESLQAIRYVRSGGIAHTVPAQLLLTHEGLVPGIHVTLSLGCAHTWDERQACLVPTIDRWGETSRRGLFVAGDGAAIAGAELAVSGGEVAALGILQRLGRLGKDEAARASAVVDRQVAPYRALRPFLDRLYRPRPEVFAPAAKTMVCRCEELTLGQLEAAIAAGAHSHAQLKSATRVGMGPCQGRQCGYSVAALLARQLDQPISEVGFYNIRPPLKPVTLRELASLPEEKV